MHTIVEIIEGVVSAFLGQYVLTNFVLSVLLAAIYPLVKLGIVTILRRGIVNLALAPLNPFERFLVITPIFLYPIIGVFVFNISLLPSLLVLGLETTIVLTVAFSKDHYPTWVYRCLFLLSLCLIAGGILGFALVLSPTKNPAMIVFYQTGIGIVLLVVTLDSVL